MDGMRKGLTLLELIVMAAVLGILTAVGIPTYRATVERQVCRHSQDLLLALYTAERVYQTDNDTYFVPTTDDEWRTLGLDNPNAAGSPVTFQVSTSDCVPSPLCFLATATYQGDLLLQIDQDRTLSSPSGRCSVS